MGHSKIELKIGLETESKMHAVLCDLTAKTRSDFLVIISYQNVIDFA